MRPVRNVRPRRAPRADSGAAAVEFALIVPVLMAVVFGIVQFGLYYNATIELSGAAREGARSMAINKNQAAATTTAKAAAANSCKVAADPCTVTFSTSTCPAGSDVTVTVKRKDFTFFPIVASKTVKIEGQAVMRCGG